MELETRIYTISGCYHSSRIITFKDYEIEGIFFDYIKDQYLKTGEKLKCFNIEKFKL